MNTKGWHITFRTHLELRAFKTRVRQRWFDDPRVGTFPEIVRDVARETGISEQDAARDVERTLKRNSVQSMLKPRHIEIARVLLANGFSAGNVATILSKVEGFPISIDVVNSNATIMAWRQTAPNENPQTRAHWGKSAEVVGPDIELYNADNAGERKPYARLPIQTGGIEYMDGEKPTLDAGQRERLVSTLYSTGLGPQQIAPILLKVTGTSYPAYAITNILQKLKREGDTSFEIRKPWDHLRLENQQIRTRMEDNKVFIYKESGGGESAEEAIATVTVSDAKITWLRDPANEQQPDRAVVDQAVAGLYASGVPPKRIPEVIFEAYATTLTPKQVMKAIEREQQRGALQRRKAGYFHSLDVRNIKARVNGECIEVYRATAETHVETGESGQSIPDSLVAAIKIKDGTIDPEKFQNENAEIPRDAADNLIARLYNDGITLQQIADVVGAARENGFTLAQVKHRLDMLERSGQLKRRGVGESNTSLQRSLRARVEEGRVVVERDGKRTEEKNLGVINLGERGTKNALDPGARDASFSALYAAGLARDDIREIFQNYYGEQYTHTRFYNKVDELTRAGKLHRRARGQALAKETQEIQYRLVGEVVTVYQAVQTACGEVVDEFALADVETRGPPEESQGDESAIKGDEAKREAGGEVNQPGEGDTGLGDRNREKSFETYVRFRWHADPRVGIASILGEELGISSSEVKRIVTRKSAWGIIKPAHVYLIQELARAGANPTETARVLETLEGLTLSQTPIHTKLQRLKNAGLLGNQGRDRGLTTEVTAEEIRVRDGTIKNIIKTIQIADAVNAAQTGFGGLYAHPPPTMEQYDAICKQARETQDSYEQIREAGGWADDTLEALLLHGVYGGDQAAYENRFRTTLDPKLIEKIVTYAKHSDLTLAEIAKKCGCGTTTAKKYACRYAFFDNIEHYNRRFNPPPLTPDQDQKANRLARENQMLAPGNRKSFTAIVNEVGGSYEMVRAAILRGTYHNDEAVFAKEFPAGQHDLSPQLVQDIIREVTNTSDSVYAIARRLETSEPAISRVALVEVYAHDYERYAARFPEKRVDEAAVAAATEHIRDPNSSYRTYKAIARAVSAEVAPISASSVMVLTRHLLTKAEREERFAGDPDYRIGQVTHVVAEGICKRAAANTGIAGYSETRLHRHHRKHDGPVPTGRQRRWVKADLILRLKDGQAGELLGRPGAEGVSPAEEAGWSPEIVAATREILFEFGADQTPASVQRKDAKYAADRHGHPRKGRLVLHVATADWWGEGRVQADPGHLANARVANLGFVADLLQMPQHEREALAEMARNNRARDQAAQERFAEKEKLSYCDDTARYYADKGIPVPDWRGPQQTLDAPIEAAQEAQNVAAGKGINPARWAEAREFAKAIQAAQDADAAREKEKDRQKDKRGIDPARWAEAKVFARALQDARDDDKARADEGPDENTGA